MKNCPKIYNEDFMATYHLTIEDAIRNMYHNPRANAYLAEFNKFVVLKNHIHIFKI